MTVLSDFLAQTKTFDVSDDNPVFHHYITELNSKAVQLAAYPTNGAARDEVQSIAQHVPTVSGGTFALTLEIKLDPANTVVFTTAAIAYDANAATIETAIDVAATAATFPAWTNADISVSGGDLNSAPVVLTFDGASVLNLNHTLTIIDGALLTGGGSAGAVTTTTHGQPNRLAWSMLLGLEVVTTAITSEHGVAPASWSIRSSADLENFPSPGLINALVFEMQFDEENLALADGLRAALNI